MRGSKAMAKIRRRKHSLSSPRAQSETMCLMEPSKSKSRNPSGNSSGSRNPLSPSYFSPKSIHSEETSDWRRCALSSKCIQRNRFIFNVSVVITLIVFAFGFVAGTRISRTTDQQDHGPDDFYNDDLTKLLQNVDAMNKPFHDICLLRTGHAKGTVDEVMFPGTNFTRNCSSWLDEHHSASQGPKQVGAHWSQSWIENCGQAGLLITEHNETKEHIWFNGTTLLLPSHSNIAHTFFENIWSLYGLSALETPPYDRVFLSADRSESCTSWKCFIVKAFHESTFGDGPADRPFVPIFDDIPKDALVCFKTLLIAHRSVYRPGCLGRASDCTVPGLSDKYRNVNLQMRNQLTSDFDAPKHNILFYAHEGKRTWLNTQEISRRLKR